MNKYAVQGIPAGRALSTEEEELIKDWPEARKEMFRLTKEYGDVSLVPAEELERVQALALEKAVSQAPVFVKVAPSESKPQLLFEELDPQSIRTASLYGGTQGINYELLWNAYPKRIYPEEGKKRGLAFAKHRIRTHEQFNEALKIVKNYATKRRGEDPKFTLKFDNFIERLEEFSTGPTKELIKTKVQRPWVSPFRPYFPWESEPNDTPEQRQAKLKLATELTVQEKQRIENDYKQKEDYDNPQNEKYWYLV